MFEIPHLKIPLVLSSYVEEHLCDHFEPNATKASTQTFGPLAGLTGSKWIVPIRPAKKRPDFEHLNPGCQGFGPHKLEQIMLGT